MKKFLIAMFMMVLSAPSFAQYSSGGFTLDEENLYYGVRIGFTSSGMGGDATKFNPDASKAGLTLGGVVGLRLSPTTPVFLESGLYYIEKGCKGTDIADAKANAKASLNYLELPIVIKYGFRAGNDVALLPFFGPYFATAIGGKTNKHSSFNDGYFKHFDAGLKLGCGVEYNMLYLEAGYQFGITNICNDDDNTAHNHGFIMNFGVNF